jgi:predicted nucleic acid-binding protein
MILVDSSVWIDYFRGVVSPQTDRLDSLLGNELLLTGDLIVAEVLQGFQPEAEFNKAKRLMRGNLAVVSLVGPEYAIQAARNYRILPGRSLTQMS